MGNESGTWIMYGVEEDDPECIHTVEEAIAYINEVGFLPLFKNDILGFSLEERTVPDYWWSGDAERDPWEWRHIIARSGRLPMVSSLIRRLDLSPKNVENVDYSFRDSSENVLLEALKTYRDNNKDRRDYAKRMEMITDEERERVNEFIEKILNERKNK